VSGLRAAENATVGSLQRARIARAAEQARSTPEAVYNPLRERLENQGTLQFAVRPKGGNWRPALKDQKNDIEQAMLPLEQRGPTTREAAIAEGGQWRMQTDEFGNPYTFADSPEGQTIMANTGALNRWLNKKLKPYIQNELGTPDDPIRLAHEQGYSHMPAFAEFGEWLPDNAATMRRQAGFPEEGFASRRHAEAGFPEANAANAQSAENWENLSDSLIGSANARHYQGFADIAKEFSGTPPPEYQHYFDLMEQNPWLAKADPNTKIYELLRSYELPDQLGFKHMVDELRASLSPNSELPEHMRLTPDSLSKVSVADAVKRVSEINSWRALQAEKAEQAGMLENLNSNARLADPTAQLSFVEKPGMTWVDIPEVVDAKGTKLCTDIGRQGGWCTMNRDTAQQYGSGDKRLVALLDAEGRPHAQAMIAESSKSPYILWYEQNPHRSPENNAFLDWVEARARVGGPKRSTDQLYLEWAKETGRTIPTQAAPDIQELKPPGNAFSSDRSETYKKRDPEYQKKVSESVIKFLNSGQWGDVYDLYHYNIVDLQRDPVALLAHVRDLSGKNNLQAHDIFNAAVKANPDAPRFMSREQFKEFLKPFIPQAEGYAEGGAVKSDFFIDPSSYAQSRSKQMFPKQKNEWTQQDATRHMLASGMMAQKFGPTVAKIAGLAHEHGTAPVKTIGYMLGIGKMPPDYDQDLHNNALGVQIGKEAKSQEDLESRIQAILNSATKQPTPGQPWIGRLNIPNQISDYARGGKVSTNPFDHLV
jgi:hypothetical protein